VKNKTNLFFKQPTKGKNTMGTLTIQFDDDAIEQLAEKIAERMGAAEPSKKDKPAAKKDKPGKGGAGTAEQIKELCTKLLDLTDKAAVKEVTSEFECSTVGKACKLEGDEAAECIEALQEAIDKADDGGSSSDDDDEVTVEAVKIAVQAFSKKNGKEDTDEILKDFGISSVRGLKKLEQSDLEELYAEVCE